VERKDQILDVACDLFARRGYEHVGIDDIGAVVGISGPAIYYYFSGKEDLLVELLLPRIGSLLEQARELLAQEEEPLVILRSLVAFHIDFVVSHPTLSQVHDRELRNLPPAQQHDVRRQMSEYVGQWAGVVRRAAGGLGDDEARATVQAVFGLINSTPVLRWGRSRGELAELLAVLALSALSGVVPALSPASAPADS
jgi:AcrR family transcriptional regulator